MAINTDLAPIMRKFAQVLPSDVLNFSSGDPLLALHAKNADLDTKLRFCKTENKLGEKVIEVERGSMWSDTYPHLDESFGLHDIKIKIKG